MWSSKIRQQRPLHATWAMRLPLRRRRWRTRWTAASELRKRERSLHRSRKLRHLSQSTRWTLSLTVRRQPLSSHACYIPPTSQPHAAHHVQLARQHTLAMNSR